MQIKNFVLSATNGGMAVEMSEREILNLAASILSHRVSRVVPSAFEDCELRTYSNRLFAAVYDYKTDETSDEMVSEDPNIVAQFQAVDALRIAAKEYK